MTTERRRSGPKPKPFAELFWAKVDKTGDCWLWTGYKMHRGYGVITITTRADGVARRGPVRAHRVSYELTYGAIPDNTMILHSCDVRACVNPDHLRPGTAFDNMRDRLERGHYANKLKTHCPQGHPYAGDNLITRKRGGRECRICSNAAQRNRKRVSSE